MQWGLFGMLAKEFVCPGNSALRVKESLRCASNKCREAPVRFGSVTVRGWNGSSGSGFRFRRFLCEKGFSVFHYNLAGKDGSSSGSVPGKRFRRFRFRYRFRENGSDGSDSRFRLVVSDSHVHLRNHNQLHVSF